MLLVEGTEGSKVAGGLEERGPLGMGGGRGCGKAFEHNRESTEGSQARQPARSHCTTDVFPNKVWKSSFRKLSFIFKAGGSNGNPRANPSGN